MARKKKVVKKTKKESTESSKLSNQITTKKIELLVDLFTSLGQLKKGDIKEFPIEEANLIISKGEGKEIP